MKRFLKEYVNNLLRGLVYTLVLVVGCVAVLVSLCLSMVPPFVLIGLPLVYLEGVHAAAVVTMCLGCLNLVAVALTRFGNELVGGFLHFAESVTDFFD